MDFKLQLIVNLSYLTSISVLSYDALLLFLRSPTHFFRFQFI